jgi:hypothetical protein
MGIRRIYHGPWTWRSIHHTLLMDRSWLPIQEDTYVSPFLFKRLSWKSVKLQPWVPVTNSNPQPQCQWLLCHSLGQFHPSNTTEGLRNVSDCATIDCMIVTAPEGVLLCWKDNWGSVLSQIRLTTKVDYIRINSHVAAIDVIRVRYDLQQYRVCLQICESVGWLQQVDFFSFGSNQREINNNGSLNIVFAF